MRYLLVCLVAATSALAPAKAHAQSSPPDNALTYQMPPPAIARIIDRPLSPSVLLSPDSAWLLIIEQPSLPGIDELAAPELRLAGLRINPRTNGSSRPRHASALVFLEIATGRRLAVTGLPADARIGWPMWSPDGRTAAFTFTSQSGIALFAADVQSGTARQLTEYNLSEATGSACAWLSTSKELLCKVIDSQRGAVPAAPAVPSGPIVQENLGGKAPTRTYQDLLQNRYHEALFDYYAAAELALVPASGSDKPRLLGIRGIITKAEPSPDSGHFLVQMVHRPYSYLVPMERFPLRVEVWSRAGRRIARIADLPLAENVPIAFGSVRTGRRNVEWRADAPATLYWAEAADGGDMKRAAAIRDHVYMQAAPFRKAPVLLAKLELRLGVVRWASDNLALISDWRWEDRRTRTLIVQPKAPGKHRVLFDRSMEDRYSDPGSPALQVTAQGTSVLRTADSEQSLFLFGDGASPEGDRPFVDKLDLATGKSQRLWRSEAPYYERPLAILDDAGNRILTSRESQAEQPNVYARDLTAKALTQLTRFPHPHPELRGMSKELIRYRRADGVMLTGTLYLPPGYKKGQRLPTLLWAYPNEFKSADAAGQVTDSPYRFSRVSGGSPILWLLRGYAVLDDPSMPIVGEGKSEPNDTYVDQLVASAKAAVDELVRRNVTDPDRVAVGGHSYGAFMTANLLAHSDLFRAGIARSGAYNRTLTPFGFQSEERTLWEAPDVYIRMSPFMNAHTMNEPLLLIHGEADSNSGTFPIQSERLYQAVKGLGGIARLVMLPHESHGYRARESVMHMLWETDRWLERYVKSPKPRENGKGPAEPRKSPGYSVHAP